MLLKGCIQHASKFEKLSIGHRTRKGEFSLQSQRMAMPKNVQTMAHLHSFHMLARLCSKILQARLQQYINWELSDVQAGFTKGRGTRDHIANIHWIIEKAREFQKNICFIVYTKAFDYVDQNKVWEILQEMRIPDYLQWTGPNWERSTSRLYIVTLLI